ncbi:MAG: DUF2185 domain-containing protein [Bacteroidales bacterium]|jgi:hypothetical protein|nr:DUF2185 domain-containing protein [Bacteroidales bacterium]MDD2569692.1 DUF2185 domain-containing protein [Bacteroidales bacterium]MDD2813154.1 DUF2185 domain-containing protein [Bacteroidales bacterium]MDD3384803.1 DUF2185 domain-containing protein [Bacteroidales bacterium]MDD3811276.1 DUF2185 domain-containing protein [Bacteroidales bacterium]
MKPTQFLLKEADIRDLVSSSGYSMVSNKITVDGLPVGYMYREECMDPEDSGWRFLSGTEDEAYLDNPDNSKALSVNVVANYDPTIIPYLKSKIGTELERIEGTEDFVEME